MRSEMPGSMQRSATRDERRLRELDRKQANTSFDLSAMPRGIVAWHKRTTSMPSLAGGTARNIASFGGRITLGRKYRLTAKLAPYSDGATANTLYEVLAYYTTNGTEPTSSSTLFAQSISTQLWGGGAPGDMELNKILYTADIVATFGTELSLPIRFLFTGRGSDAAKTYGVVGSANLPMEFFLIDEGLDTDSQSEGIDY